MLPSLVERSKQDLVLIALPATAASAAVLRALRSEGISTTAVSDWIGVLDALRGGGIGLLVLDLDLAGVDSEGMLEAVRREAPTVPVIAITARGRRTSAVSLLRGHQDDYLLRPFAVDELAARIRLRLRADLPLEQTILRRGELVVDITMNRVSIDGHTVPLSPTEFALLMALIEVPGQAVSQERLAELVWSRRNVSNVVQVYISYLRRKIGSERIRTIRGAGYVFEA